MNYFPKRKKPSKKGEYLQIYISEYIPGKGSRNRFHIALGYLSDMIARGIANPVSYAKKMVAELNDSKEKKAPQIEETSVLKNVGYFLLKAMIGSLSIDSDLAMMTTDGIYEHFTVCYLALTVLRLLEIKVFNEKLTPAEIIVFIRDYNVT